MLTVVLVILVLLFAFGGYGGRRAGWYGDGTWGIDTLLYILAVVLVIWLLLRLFGLA